MPCLPLPKIAPPTLPSPLSLSAPLPSVPSVTVQAPCCLLPPFTTPKIPIPIGPLVLNPGTIGILRTATAIVEAYDDLVALDCPRSLTP